MTALAGTPPDAALAADVVAPSPFALRQFRVSRRHRDTRDTVTLALDPLDGLPLAFEPGQFTMLYAFGVGEVPISISGDPAHPDELLHTIRDVGGVTHALTRAARGDVLGVRGPYGCGWDVSDGRGGDVVIVAGGIGLAPLRPALLAVLAARDDYGRVVVLYGCRSPQDVLYARELEHWRGRFDLDVDVTVDYGPPQWRGRVGLVHSLIPRAGFDPAHTLALVCGPEAMMRTVAAALVERGVARERVRLSMERAMDCGVGLCGHCQLRELFVCVDGPVFGYDRLERLLWLQEV
jgi:NAD(P)H-flavin reductase